MAPYLETVMMYAKMLNTETFSNTYQHDGKIDPKMYDPKHLIDPKSLPVETFQIA